MRRFAVIGLGLLVGCGGASGYEDADDPSGDVDASLPCIEDVIEIGDCLTADGQPCTSPGAGTEFVPLATGDVITPIVGVQGLPMFVLALRARDLDPGAQDEPATWPQVEATIDWRGEPIANFYSRTYFEPGEGGLRESLSLFLVLAAPAEELEGEPITARASVTDRGGQPLCGTLALTAGALEE